MFTIDPIPVIHLDDILSHFNDEIQYAISGALQSSDVSYGDASFTLIFIDVMCEILENAHEQYSVYNDLSDNAHDALMTRCRDFCNALNKVNSSGGEVYVAIRG
jgi:hypothetical protein